MSTDSNLILEHVVCDLCGQDDAALVTISSDHEHVVPGEFQVVHCQQCGLYYLNPRPTADTIGQCYPGDYYAYSSSADQRGNLSLKKRVKRLIRSHQTLSSVAKHIAPLRHAAEDSDIADDVHEWIKPGNVLDIGCGAGAFLDAMRENGWTTYGIEPSAGAAAAACAKGHAVFCQSATEPVPEELARYAFDLVLMSHSLEHVHSPTQALANLRPLLKQVSGRLIIEVPNVESLLTYWFGELGLAFDSPRHLYLFSPETLRKMLEKTGFAVHSMRHVSRPMQFVRCLQLLSETATPGAWRKAADEALKDRELLQAFESLAKFATGKRMGGAIRVVATRR